MVASLLREISLYTEIGTVAGFDCVAYYSADLADYSADIADYSAWHRIGVRLYDRALRIKGERLPLFYIG